MKAKPESFKFGLTASLAVKQIGSWLDAFKILEELITPA